MFERSRKSRFSCRDMKFSTGVSAVAANPVRTSEERVYEVVLKQAALVREDKRSTKGLSSEMKRKGSKSLDTSENDGVGMKSWNLLNEAYDRCGEVCAEYAKTFYLGMCIFITAYFLSFFYFKMFFKANMVRTLFRLKPSIIAYPICYNVMGPKMCESPLVNTNNKLLKCAGTLLMTPERRRAVWAIYGMSKDNLTVIFLAQ